MQRQGGEDCDSMCVTTAYVDESGNQISYEEHWQNTADGIEGYKLFFSSEELSEISMIGIFSDGIEQVSNRKEALPWFECAAQLTSFKNLAGQFLVRRAMRFMRNMSKSSYVPLDDLSGAVLIFDHNQEVSNESNTS